MSEQQQKPAEVIDPETGEILASEEAAELAAQRVSKRPLDAENMAGFKVQRIITTRDFLPGRDKAWALAWAPQQAPGTTLWVGEIVGSCVGTERTITDYMGKKLESVWMKGSFEALIFHSKQVLSASNLILPLAFGELMEQAFRLSGVMRGDIDVDVGLTATGKMITYEWAIVSYIDGEAQERLNALKARRLARKAAQIEGPAQQKQIAAQ